jgi:hypothetical protein
MLISITLYDVAVGSQKKLNLLHSPRKNNEKSSKSVTRASLLLKIFHFTGAKKKKGGKGKNRGLSCCFFLGA